MSILLVTEHRHRSFALAIPAQPSYATTRTQGEIHLAVSMSLTSEDALIWQQQQLYHRTDFDLSRSIFTEALARAKLKKDFSITRVIINDTDKSRKVENNH